MIVQVENIVTMVRNEVKGAGLQDTRENCWKFFIDRVRRQLKVSLLVYSFAKVH
jgi:dynein heavy chain